MNHGKLTTKLLATTLMFALSVDLFAQGEDAGVSDDPPAPGRTLANNSISIGAPVASTDVAVTIDDTTASSADTPGKQTTPPAVASEPTQAPQETLPLGASGGSAIDLSSEASAADSSSGGMFGGFDPRDSELLRVGGALLVVLGLLWLMRVFVRRAGLVTQAAGKPSGVLEVLARYPVGRRENLVLLKMHRRIVLVHQGDGRMSPLAEVTDPNEVAALLARVEEGSSGRQATRFKAMLSQFNAEHDVKSPPEQTTRRLPRLRRAVVEDDQVVDLTRPTPGFGLLRVNRSA